jgi:hypothetical protein
MNSEIGRRYSIARARLSFSPTLSRSGRVSRQARRCLIAKNGVATMTQLKAWVTRAEHTGTGNTRSFGKRCTDLGLVRLIEPVASDDPESGRSVAKAVADRNETDGNLN